HVVESLIESRLLVAAIPQSWVSDEEFHLIWSDKTILSDSAIGVRDWIIAQTR
ncbi:MAG: hypothetical protein ACI9LO_003232, partial [Planctomycetota bacterium]